MSFCSIKLFKELMMKVVSFPLQLLQSHPNNANYYYGLEMKGKCRVIRAYVVCRAQNYLAITMSKKGLHQWKE